MGDDAKPSCSFCGKMQDEVCMLMAGPRVHICEECVEACVRILKQKGVWPSPPVWLFRAIRHGLAGR